MDSILTRPYAPFFLIEYLKYIFSNLNDTNFYTPTYIIHRSFTMFSHMLNKRKVIKFQKNGNYKEFL